MQQQRKPYSEESGMMLSAGIQRPIIRLQNQREPHHSFCLEQQLSPSLSLSSEG